MVKILFSALAAALLGAPAHAQPAGPRVLTTADAAPAGLRPALAAADAALAGPVREARRTLAQAKKRYLAGLTEGGQLMLTVRVQAADTSFRQVAARVLGWHGSTVQVLLPGAADSQAAGSAEPVPVSLPEAAVLDWTIRRANGREEGNFVGRYLDTARQLEDLPLR